MLKNIILFLIIIITSYLIIVFKLPNLASTIENTIWINWLWNKIIEFKNTTNWIVTNIPTKDEVNNAYDDFYSWAIDFKDNFKEWATITKNKINDIRKTVNSAQDTYNDIKWWIDDAKEFIDSASWAINQAKDLLENVSDITNNTWTIN